MRRIHGSTAYPHARESSERPFYPVKKAAVACVPSAAVFLEIRRRAAAAEDEPRSGLLGLADPEIDDGPALPAAREEPQGLRGLFLNGPTEILEGPVASEAAFKKKAPDFRYTHIAAAGKVDAETSFLRLARGGQENGQLEAREIAALRGVRAELVVLSSCGGMDGSPSLGTPVAGRLSRAFPSCRARSVVSALWPVKDAGTAELMFQFYSNPSSHPNKARALRKAKLMFIDDRRHPCNSAGFVPEGDPR